MHIDKVKQLWMQKQRAGQANGNQLLQQHSSKTQQMVGTRKTSVQDRSLQGEYITRDGRIDQVNYSKKAHFRVGYDPVPKPTTTTGSNSAWLATHSLPVATGVTIVKDFDDRRTKSNFILGNQRPSMSRKLDTSTGSAYLPKRNENHSTSHTKEVTKEMRRTNFTLGFTKTNALEPRVITVISEEDEYKTGAAALKKPNLGMRQRANRYTRTAQFNSVTTNQVTYKRFAGTLQSLTEATSPNQSLSIKNMSQQQRHTNFRFGFEREGSSRDTHRQE